MSRERLDKIIAARANLSRREARDLIRRGRVLVNGAAETAPETPADAETDTLTVDGTPLLPGRFAYLMLHKPAGVLSASRDGRTPTVIDLVPPELKRKGLFPAGRLDKDTTGFVLLTDDGGFAHRILSPKNHVYKTYEVRLARPVSEAALQTLENGMTLEDGTALLPAFARLLDGGTLVSLEIREGKFHQVKRMFAALGSEVAALKRTSIGGLALDDSLPPGECRSITERELQRIFEGRR